MPQTEAVPSVKAHDLSISGSTQKSSAKEDEDSIFNSKPDPTAVEIAQEKVRQLKKKADSKDKETVLKIQNIIKLDPDTISHRLIESV